MTFYRRAGAGSSELGNGNEDSQSGEVALVHRQHRSARPQKAVRLDVALVTIDVALVTVAYVLALLLRFDGDIPRNYWEQLVVFLPLAAACYVALLARRALYGRVWRQAGADEAWSLLMVSGTAVLILTLLDLATSPQRLLPLTVPANAGAITLILLGGARFHTRFRGLRQEQAGAGTATLLVGPAVAARAVAEQIRREPESGVQAVAVVTDEQATWGRSLSGVPVVGPVSELGAFAKRYDAEQVLLLPGSLSGNEVRAIADRAREAGLPVRSLPTLHETMRARSSLTQIRDLSLVDLLGRDQVDVDDLAIRSIITGHRVLITGAGGSIGSELAIQIARLAPSELLLLDHDETHLHDTVALLSSPACSVLGDIRDRVFVERLFLSARPEVVFHAAAHKHVPILESYPSEAVRTNVHGTLVLVRAAVLAGTERFVAISTDKAVAPRCVMGASKRVAEQLVVHHDAPGRHFSVVRFGNVLGSRGSVVPTFVEQVRTGGPLTVTHPDMTRYFMTTTEAVSLVTQAAATAKGGEIFLLDMGEPVRIVDLAERIIGLAGLTPGKDIEVTYTGLRPGEKLTEELSSSHESVHQTSHPKVRRVGSSLSDRRLLLTGVTELCRRAWAGDEEPTRSLLFELARMPEEVQLHGEVLALARGSERARANGRVATS